jgi:uncharacterized protein YukE
MSLPHQKLVRLLGPTYPIAQNLTRTGATLGRVRDPTVIFALFGGEEQVMKFAMGAETLTVLTKQTSSANDDLGSLVKQLFAAAEPIQGKFNGAGRAAFDRFKGETDQIANELNSALAAVLGGIQGQNTAFLTGEQQMVDETTAAQGGANFESARFSGSR